MPRLPHPALLLAALTIVALAAASPAILPAQAAAPAPPGTEPWRGPAAIGVAVENDAGKPVAGASVRLRLAALPGTQGPAPLVTDASGRAVAGHLAEGEWIVEVSHPGHMVYTAQVEARAGKAAKSVYASQVSTGGSWAALRVELFRVREMPPPAPAVAAAAPAAPPAAAAPAAPPTAGPASPSAAAPPRAAAPAPLPATPAAPSAPPPPATSPDAAAPPAAPAPAAPPAPAPPAAPPPRPEPDAAPPAAPAPSAPPRAVPEQPATPPSPAPPQPAADAAEAPPQPAAPPADGAGSAPPQPPAPPAPTPPAPPAAAPPAAAPPASQAPPAAPQPPSPPAAAPPPAPPELPAAPPVPAASLRARDHGTCPECGAGEWAATDEVAATAAAAPADCAAAATAAQQALGALVGTGSATPDAWVGPLRALVGGEPPPSPCGIAAVVLPAGAKFIGYRYEAVDARGAGECVADQECSIGAARWQGHPRFERGAQRTVVWSVFENRSPERLRQARLTVYFVPPAGWAPPAGH